VRSRLLLIALLVGPLAASGSAQAVKLVADDAAAFDQLGGSLSLSGRRLAVGSHFSDGADFNTGAVYVWRQDVTGWALEAKIEPSDPAINDQFGYDVALDGDTLLVGTQTSLGGGAELTGSAQILRRVEGRWVLEASLAPEQLTSLSRFGWTVDLEGDRALVGAPFHSADFEFSGAAWTFRREGARWIDEGLLLPHDPAEDQLFGHDVALSGDLAAVSAVWHGQAESPLEAVYLFQHDGTGWTEIGKISPEDLGVNDDFGAALALDHGRVAISSPSDDDDGNASGAVYVYARGPTGWELEQKLTADDASQDDHFGQDVALSGDTLVVGAIDVAGSTPWGGAVYVFRWTGESWRQEVKLTPSGLLPFGYFGSSVSVDGQRVAGGAHLDDGAAEHAGAAYVYDRSQGNGAEPLVR
jgi:hypothetical protein